MLTIDKHTLLKIANKDSKKAFKLFFDAYYTRLIKFAMLFVKDYYQAEDIVSDVLVKMLKKRKELFALENFEGYLFLSVKNQAISYNKKHKLGTYQEIKEIENDFLYPDYEDPEKMMLQQELIRVLEDAVNQLSPRRKMVFKLIKDEKLKYKEVAELMDITVKTVENHMDLAIKQLRETLTDYIQSIDTKRNPDNMMINNFILILLSI